MTRKRFIKLMMAYGIPRNEGEKLADCVAKYGLYDCEYKELFEHMRFALPFMSLGKTIRQAGRMFERAKRGVDRLAEEFKRQEEGGI